MVADDSHYVIRKQLPLTRHIVTHVSWCIPMSWFTSRAGSELEHLVARWGCMCLSVDDFLCHFSVIYRDIGPKLGNNSSGMGERIFSSQSFSSFDLPRSLKLNRASMYPALISVEQVYLLVFSC